MFIRFDYRERALISAFQKIQKSKLDVYLSKQETKEAKKRKSNHDKIDQEDKIENESEDKIENEIENEIENTNELCLKTFGWKMEEGRLDIGDILINNEIIIERKTLNDLLASLKDGRYEEQSFRLKELKDRIDLHNIWYMLEGNPMMIQDEIQQQSIYTSMVSLNVVKGFSVFRNSSPYESALFLFYTMQKLTKEKKKTTFSNPSSPPVDISEMAAEDLEENESKFLKPSSTTSSSYVSVASTQNKRKQDFVTPDNIDMLMLCQIPLIKDQTAIGLIKHFGSIWEMSRRYALYQDAIFEDVRMQRPDGKKIKLSEAIQKNLKRYLFASAIRTFANKQNETKRKSGDEEERETKEKEE